MVDNILLKDYFVNIDLCLFKLNRKYHRYQVNLQKIIDVSSDKMELLEHLALAEAFLILYGDFQQRTSEIK